MESRSEKKSERNGAKGARRAERSIVPILNGGLNVRVYQPPVNENRGKTGEKSGFTDILRTAKYETRTLGGGRGALAGLQSRQPSTRSVSVKNHSSFQSILFFKKSSKYLLAVSSNILQ